jgi:riboflavin synthase
MFTGIVEEVGRVVSAQHTRLVISAGTVLGGLEIGGSISVNGVCLTAIDFDDRSFTAEVMQETLRRSNLGLLSAGSRVNLERPLALGGPLGGHLVQGHVDDTGRVAAIRKEREAYIIRFETSPGVMRYVVEKGFIAADGISLTVTSRAADFFEVSVVDFTRQHTILNERKVGDTVNLEVDIIAKYVEHLCNARNNGITAEFLREHGFMVG